MKKYRNFQAFWEDYESKSISDRRKYFNSISKKDQKKLIEDLFSSKFSDLIAQNILDHLLDYIKSNLNIDIIELRTQAIMLNKIALVPKKEWEQATEIIMKLDGVCNTDSVFGGLCVQDWGKNKSLCKIRYRRV